ncbi:DUF4013 domain-containing protein [Lignipirellula cremea]|uniref:DUF4013 domain-containing protein n=1 Tax=Lignipirellula cremea TaxID=2528010 RepID=A0A518DXZ7_9BACT|nr:DUF4013 domain-containing protein [Lignipirellula cremea]QDU96722.1 hypothetical protein Pla8534_45430 [Lignipirellula cremea]
MSSFDPYASPQDHFGGAKPAPAGKGMMGDGSQPPHAMQMDYMRCWTILFERPNGFGLVCILGAVGLFIPYIGQVVVIGYAIDACEAIRRGVRRDFCDFDFGRFGEYLLRGLWPMLVALIVMFPIVLGIMVIAFVPMMGAAAMMDGGGNGALPVVGILIMVGAFLLAFVAGMLGTAVMMGMQVRAAFAQSLGEGFNVGWAWDFLKRTWLEMILGLFLLSMIGGVVINVGLLLLCVGVIPAMGLMMVANWFFLGQLYELYLSRGGQPIPLKAPKPEAVSRWQAP